MGCVTEIRTSGDNDTPIFPVQYEMHYYYCDKCGSFDIKYWEELPGEAEGVGQKLQRLFIKPKPELVGAYCNSCQAEYRYGSPFFDTDQNPRNYTMDDVPLPLNQTYHRRGATLGPAED